MGSSAERALEQEILWRRCADDEVFFLSEFCMIRVPGKGRVRFEPRDAQLETLQLWNEHRYSVALKARQIGFSTLAALHSLWVVLFHADRRVVMISKGEREAASLLKKSAYAYRALPAWFRERSCPVSVDNMSKLAFEHDSEIESLPSGEDPGRSDAVDEAIVDEWAFLPNPEDAWASIEPITDVGGVVRGISTAKGSGNFFHNLYVGAKTGANEFRPIFYPWSANTDRDKHWYESKRRNMTEAKLHQEYPRDDEECFVKSGNPVFDMDAFPGLAVVEPERGMLSKRLGELTFSESSNGGLKLFERPVAGRHYVIGADVAEGLEHGDWSVAHVIDVKSNRVVAVYRSHVDPDIFGKQVLWMLGQWYNNALIGVEANNHGLTTATALRDTAYTRIYYRHKYDERFGAVEKKIGFYTSAKSKPVIVDELRENLRDGLVVPDSDTVEELRLYSRDANGRMSGSPFDDHVMSLAIANKMIDHVYASEYEPSRPLPEMSAKRIFGDALADDEFRGGLLSDQARGSLVRG